MVYPVATAGMGPATRCAVGPAEPADTVADSYFQGQVAGAVQAAPNSRKLAFGQLITLGTRPPLGLFDFDPVTGAAPNYLTLWYLANTNSPVSPTITPNSTY